MPSHSGETGVLRAGAVHGPKSVSMVRSAGGGFNTSPMLKQLESCEARLASIDGKLSIIAEYYLKMTQGTVIETPAAPNTDPVYRDTKYTCDRVCISESTLLRCQRRGEITVARRTKGKKYFLDSDVECLRSRYRGGK